MTPISKILIIILLNISFCKSSLTNQLTLTDTLPKNMPILKQIIWGNNGVFRKSFINPQSRIKELKIRRNMLQLHQRLALLTMGTLAYQYQTGKEMVNNPQKYNELKNLHMKLGYISFTTYMGAAGLSIFAPPGMKYTQKKLTSNKIHRYLAVIHFTGMAIQPWLGYQTSVAGIERRFDDREKLLKMHETVGGITLSTYFLAFLTTLFK